MLSGTRRWRHVFCACLLVHGLSADGFHLLGYHAVRDHRRQVKVTVRAYEEGREDLVSNWTLGAAIDPALLEEARREALEQDATWCETVIQNGRVVSDGTSEDRSAVAPSLDRDDDALAAGRGGSRGSNAATGNGDAVSIMTRKLGYSVEEALTIPPDVAAIIVEAVVQRPSNGVPEAWLQRELHDDHDVGDQKPADGKRAPRGRRTASRPPGRTVASRTRGGERSRAPPTVEYEDDLDDSRDREDDAGVLEESERQMDWVLETGSKRRRADGSGRDRAKDVSARSRKDGVSGALGPYSGSGAYGMGDDEEEDFPQTFGEKEPGLVPLLVKRVADTVRQVPAFKPLLREDRFTELLAREADLRLLVTGPWLADLLRDEYRWRLGLFREYLRTGGRSPGEAWLEEDEEVDVDGSDVVEEVQTDGRRRRRPRSSQQDELRPAGREATAAARRGGRRFDWANSPGADDAWDSDEEWDSSRVVRNMMTASNRRRGGPWSDRDKEELEAEAAASSRQEDQDANERSSAWSWSNARPLRANRSSRGVEGRDGVVDADAWRDEDEENEQVAENERRR